MSYSNPRIFKVALLASLLAVGIPLWAQRAHNFSPGFNLFSKEQDVQLGQESAAQVRKQMKPDPQLIAAAPAPQ